MKQIPYSDTLDATYGAIEAKLAKDGYNVLHLMRDTRGDWVMTVDILSQL